MKKTLLIAIVFILVVGAGWSFAWLRSRPKTLAVAERIDERGYPYTVRIRLEGQRYLTDLTFNNRLPVTVFNIYAGSDPSENVGIEWTELSRFKIVSDGEDEIISCEWNHHKAYWRAFGELQQSP